MRVFILLTVLFFTCIRISTAYLRIIEPHKIKPNAETVGSMPKLMGNNIDSNALFNYIMYFNELRFNWNNRKEWNTEYIDRYPYEWKDILSNHYPNTVEHGCTFILPLVYYRLCAFEVKHKHSHSLKFIFLSNNEKLNLDGIELQFENDNHWSSMERMNVGNNITSNNIFSITKCKPFPFLELCVIHIPLLNEFHVHIKIAHKKKLKDNKSRHKSLAASNAMMNIRNSYYGVGNVEENQAISVLGQFASQTSLL